MDEINWKEEIPKIDRWMEAYNALPISAKVAWHRPGILNQCLRWRKFIKDGDAKGGIDPFAMLKWQQKRLADFRARREGREIVVH